VHDADCVAMLKYIICYGTPLKRVLYSWGIGGNLEVGMFACPGSICQRQITHERRIT